MFGAIDKISLIVLFGEKTLIDLFDKKTRLICCMSSIMNLIDGLYFFKDSIIDLFDDKIKGLLCLIKDYCFIF